MMFISIMILIVAIALPSINRNIYPNLYLRISSLLLLYTGALAFNAFYIQSIGSGIGIYNGLFQITLFLSLELQSFGVYILASLYRHSELAISAGLKYFLLGSLASCIILLGCGLIYTLTGLTNLESIYSMISVIDNNNNILLGFSLGLILIFIGLLFKIAAAPLHN